MTAERVSTQQKHIQTKYECADPNTKIRIFAVPVIVKEEPSKSIECKEKQKQQREVQKIAMNVLHDQRQVIFAEII